MDGSGTPGRRAVPSSQRSRTSPPTRAPGGRLRAAQEKALRGGDADAVRAATRDERDALRKLTRLAEAVLADAGRPASPQTLERVSSTLRAAAVDSDAAKLLTSGRLAEEV